MDEFNDHINCYCKEYYSCFSNEENWKWNEWVNTDSAKIILSKYWLQKQEYLDKWKLSENNIFKNSYKIFPDLAFKEDFNLIVLQGGVLLPEEHLNVIISFLKKMNELNFVVIQDYRINQLEHAPTFRIKLPSTITKAELMSGNYISTVLFEMFYEQYFVFSESSLWGLYYDNESVETPAIFGFKDEIKDIVLQTFEPLKDEIREMYSVLNDEYKIKSVLIE